MHQRTVPEAAVYQGYVDQREVMPRHSYNKTRILLIFIIAFSQGRIQGCKRQSRISFLWNVKQAKKRLRSGLIRTESFCVFPCGNFPLPKFFLKKLVCLCLWSQLPVTLLRWYFSASIKHVYSISHDY